MGAHPHPPQPGRRLAAAPSPPSLHGRAPPSSSTWSPASPCATSFIELGLEQLGGDEEQASPLKRVVHTVAVGDFQGQSAPFLSNRDSGDVGQDVRHRRKRGGDVGPLEGEVDAELCLLKHDGEGEAFRPRPASAMGPAQPQLLIEVQLQQHRQFAAGHQQSAVHLPNHAPTPAASPLPLHERLGWLPL
ncbi:uncharacterized protein LOC119362095 [Triticum dicoccoides]|uniref:uncharacterized protein LOC119362095 n=1 Tax=Triticum dicoccoides TaxID=85692 RepID=UPI00188FA7FF|nr:uncharacterized protein LOC119362095 [Triticum dicoccoides]